MNTYIKFLVENLFNQYNYNYIFEAKTKESMSFAKIIINLIEKTDIVSIENFWKDLSEDVQKALLKKINKDNLKEVKGCFIKKYHFPKINKDLNIIYLQHSNLDFNSFDPDNNRLVLTSIDENVKNIANEIAHEFSHILDWARGNDYGNDTYTPGQDELLFDKFLYLISNTEQKAMKTNLKKILLNNKQIQNMVLSNKLTKDNVNDVIKALCSQMINERHNALKNNNAVTSIKLKYNDKEETYKVYSEEKLPNEIRGKVENPLRLLEYNFYLIDNIDNFTKFINNDEITEEKRPEAVKQYILSKLSVYTKGNKNIKDIYNAINKVYKQTYNNYIQDLKNAITYILKNNQTKK